MNDDNCNVAADGNGGDYSGGGGGGGGSGARDRVVRFFILSYHGSRYPFFFILLPWFSSSTFIF